jgi:hypothetical protein
MKACANHASAAAHPNSCGTCFHIALSALSAHLVHAHYPQLGPLNTMSDQDPGARSPQAQPSNTHEEAATYVTPCLLEETDR